MSTGYRIEPPSSSHPVRLWRYVRDFAQHPQDFAKYWWARTYGRVMCARHGHPQERVHVLLGYCPRCYADTPGGIWPQVVAEHPDHER